jgi:hypothetical protein
MTEGCCQTQALSFGFEVQRLVGPAAAVAVVLLGVMLAPIALAGGPLAPVLSRTVVVATVSGRVTIEPRGAHTFSELTAQHAIPVGSTVDTTHGTVKLLTADTNRGRAQYGLFDGGAFVISQDRSGLTTLRLVGGRSQSKVCAPRHRAARASAVSASVLRLLHGMAHGRFRTLGRYAAATVRGTDWTTTEGCGGTRIGDRSGQVATQTNNAPLSNPLGPGQQAVYRCVPHGEPPVSSAYCIVVLTTDTTAVINGRRVREFDFGTGLATKSPDETYDLCIAGPKRTVCTTYPLGPPVLSGFRISAVACVPQQGPGDYVLTWKVRGVALGARLSFHSPIAAPVLRPCGASLGNGIVGSHLTGSFNADFKNVTRYSLPTTALGLAIAIFLHPSAISGQQVLRGIVYADSGGAPGALLGTTDELAYQSSEPPDWYALTFPRLLHLVPGNYWIGVILGGQSGVAGVAYDTVPGVLDYNANPYSAGPSDPFGPIATGDVQLSLYMAYEAVGS